MLHGRRVASPAKGSECDQQHRGERRGYGRAERAVVEPIPLSLDSLRQQVDELGSWLRPSSAELAGKGVFPGTPPELLHK